MVQSAHLDEHGDKHKSFSLKSVTHLDEHDDKHKSCSLKSATHFVEHDDTHKSCSLKGVTHLSTHDDKHKVPKSATHLSEHLLLNTNMNASVLFASYNVFH